MHSAEKTLIALSCAALLAACGGASNTAQDPSAASGPDANAVLTAKCGTCHAEPAAGEKSKAEIETSLGEHTDRVQLTDAEKQALVEHLGT